ncbi:MAG: ISLre2 family transposase [Oscillospiraceae bacterium]|nr:ISLre2 family transposase [Oscillospiraceae bacterium]
MECIIDEILGKLKIEIEGFVRGDKHSIDEAERYFVRRIDEAVLRLLAGYYEGRDAELRADKSERKAAGLSIERLGDERHVLTQMGELKFRRTYYKKASGGYEYPIDEEAGLESYQRLSTGVGIALVENAAVMSYGKASELVTGGQISRQSVLNKIRISYPKKSPAMKRKAAVLHIDADEDHVALQTGESAIVPLISGYEGIRKNGRRGECVNVFHYSEYGRTPAENWEAFYDELDRRYDLYKTKIYLHGDGANWIQAGRDYLPNCTFVLDRYHVNSAMKQVVAGFDGGRRKQYLKCLTEAERSGDREQYARAVKSICLHGEERNAEAARYLLNNFDAIHVYHTDPEASNGGATEPHVSHVLSSRLSSRPMGWSQETLKHLVPILAEGAACFTAPPEEEEVPFKSEFKYKEKPKKKYIPNSLGMPDPDTAVFPRTRTGHRPYALRLLT